MHDSRYGRRALLGGGSALGLAVLGLAGCGLLDRQPEPPRPDALEPLRNQAASLAGQYSAAIHLQPDLAARLTPLRGAHLTHVAELTRLIGRPAPSYAAVLVQTSATADLLAGLRTAEEAAATDAVAACLAAPADRAALVGSIAACRTTHVEALR